jgi:hypothetical protein
MLVATVGLALVWADVAPEPVLAAQPARLRLIDPELTVETLPGNALHRALPRPPRSACRGWDDG